jgi:hypothetical protein
MLRDCIASGEASKDLDAAALKRISDISEFMEQAVRWCDRAQSMSPSGVRRLAQLSDKVFKLI